MKEINELKTQDKHSKEEIDKLCMEKNDLTAALNDEKSLSTKLQDELNKIIKTQEEEVQLRL
jgi:hypothetical protein